MARLATPPSRVRVLRIIGVMWMAAALPLGACASKVAGPPPVVQAPSAPRPATPTPPSSAAADKVAILLPLSGASAQIGQPLLEAAQLALFDVGADRFELLPRDTKGTPAASVEAARQAIADGAKLFLGPLYGPDVAAVKPIAAAAGVEMIAFTTDWTLAGNGAFIFGFLPGEQVTRVVGFARSRGVTRIAAMAPRNAYGDVLIGALQAASTKFGFQITQIERYDSSLTDFTIPVRQIATAPEAPQALLLAEGGERLKALAAALAAGGVDPARVHLLGTGTWDEPGLGRERALVGGWYAAPTPEMRADFEARFEALYGRKPPRLATLAYDAAALAGKLSRDGGETPFTRARLTDAGGFAGVDGLFRLKGNGVSERGLAVLQVRADGVGVADPAPAGFESLGQ